MIIYTRKNTYPITRLAILRGMRTRRQFILLALRVIGIVALAGLLAWLTHSWLTERKFRIAAIDRAILTERASHYTDLAFARCMNKKSFRDTVTGVFYFCDVSEQRL